MKPVTSPFPKCILLRLFTFKCVCLCSAPQPSLQRFLHSDDTGLHPVCVHRAVAARLAPLVLPVAVGRHLGRDAAALLLRGGQAAQDGGQLGTGGDAARLGEGGAVVVEVVADRLIPPAKFAAVGPPLSPLPFESCLGLRIHNESQPELNPTANFVFLFFSFLFFC